MRRKTVFKIITAVPAVAATIAMVFVGWLTFTYYLPDYGLEFGYFGQFNRVKHIIEAMPGTVIIDHWQHQDITLEDFGFTIRLSDGRVVQVDFWENSPQMKERKKQRLKEFIQGEIDSTGTNNDGMDEAHGNPEPA